MKDVLNYILSAVLAVGAFLFGEIDGLFYALIALIVIDYATGIISAFVQKSLSSAVGAKGIAKKIFMLGIVAVANMIDVNVIGDGAVIRNIVIMFYIANECISILENAGKLGVPVPKKLLDVLAQLKKEGE